VIERCNNSDGDCGTSGKVGLPLIFITPMQEKMVCWCRICSPYFLWVLFAEAFLLLLVIFRTYKEDPWLLVSYVATTTMLAFCGSMVIWASKKLKDFFPLLCLMVQDPEAKVFRVYRRELQKIFCTKWMIIAGGFIALVTVCYEYRIGVPINLVPMKVALLGVLHITEMFFAGAAAYALIRVSTLVDRLFRTVESGGKESLEESPQKEERLTLHVSIYQHPEVGLLSIGRLLRRFALAAVFAYLLTFAGRRLGPWKWDVYGWIWYLSFATFIVSFFVVSQWGVRKIMDMGREQELVKLTKKIQECVSTATENPTQENISALERVLSLERHIRGMRRSPLSAKALGALLPLLVPFMECLLTHFLS